MAYLYAHGDSVATSLPPVSADLLTNRILVLRGHKVLLGNDLADLYEVEHRALMQAVNRNIGRFPADFMFQVSEQEWSSLKSQIVISSWGGIRKLPHAFI